MTEFVKIITHVRRFKSAVKNVSIEQLEEVRTKLDTIIEQRKEEFEEAQIKDKEKLKKIAKIKEMLAADGLGLDDLQDVGTTSGKKRGNRPPKYAIEVDGVRTTWTGQGRMPNVFKSKVDAGEDIDNYII